MNASQKIRVVVLTRGENFEAWEAEALRKVMALDFAEIVLCVQDASDADVPQSFFQKIRNYKWHRLFWNRWFRKYGEVNATQPESMKVELADVPVILVKPELRGKYSQHFSQDDLARVQTYSPDVIIRFGFNILRGEILTLAKHGVWSFHHADHRVIRGGPASFWEYILGHRTTGAILQRLTDKLDDGIILRSGYFELVRHSFRENLDNLLSSTTGWISNALTEIHLTGNVAVQQESLQKNVRVYLYPDNLRMMGFWFILLRNKFAFHWKNLFCPETWMVGIVDQPFTEILENGINSAPKWIKAKSNAHYVADPFSYEVNGELEIAAEEYSYETGKGIIINLKSGQPVLERPFHLSFPFPIRIDEQTFLLAEGSASGKLTAFALTGQADDINFMNEAIVDPVVVYHDNRWWLFCNKLDEQNNAALFIYYASRITDEFLPHALNPVKTDIRNSRSAGPITLHNGKLLRPAQDSGLGYGSRIVINEIHVLTPEQFQETAIHTIEPKASWDYNKGLHTISPLGKNQTLIDAKSYRFNFANFKAELSRKFGRVFK